MLIYRNKDTAIQHAVPLRNIWFENENIKVRYTIENAYFQSNRITIENFGITSTPEKPAIPVREDIFTIPDNKTPIVKITSSSYQTYYDVELAPAQEPLPDTAGYTPNIKPIRLYSGFYPNDIIQTNPIQHYRDKDVLSIMVYPVQYDHQEKVVRVYSLIEYEISFLDKSNNASPKKETFAPTKTSALFSPSLRVASSNETDKILILSTSRYKQAANNLANWKRLLGFRVDVITRNDWTTSTIKQIVQNSYQADKSLLFLILLGDHEDLPGITKNNFGSTYVTDYYYGCMDDENDVLADIYRGRLSVSSAEEAITVVEKIIQYEKNPPTSPSFYNNGLVCAYFEDDDKDSYADRIFAQTAEEVRTYLDTHIGKNIDRAYYTNTDVYPKYWNNGTYSHGEPIPSDLRKDIAPFFAWNATSNDIITAINSGKFFVLHRDHGSTSGWAEPYFNIDHITQCNNGNKLPIVFSINCLTGNFSAKQCFTETFIRKKNGGCVAIFGASAVSYSGYNDALTIGMFDAIWPNPGLRPQFGYSVNYDNVLPTPTPTYQLGQILDQGLFRMKETWNERSLQTYTAEIFHCFGDPSMRIYTEVPQKIQNVSIYQSNETLRVSCSTPNVTITFLSKKNNRQEVHHNTSVASYTLTDDNDISICLSKHNYIPVLQNVTRTIYIQNETISGNKLYSSPLVKIGSNVTTSKPFGPVTIKNGSNITVSGDAIVIEEETTIENNTTINVN